MTTESLWSKAQPRGISRSLPRKKAGLALYTKKMYIKPTSHCLILYQYIMGELYTIISEGKFTQSFFDMPIELDQENVYNSQRKFFDRGRGNGREDNLNR